MHTTCAVDLNNETRHVEKQKKNEHWQIAGGPNRWTRNGSRIARRLACVLLPLHPGLFCCCLSCLGNTEYHGNGICFLSIHLPITPSASTHIASMRCVKSPNYNSESESVELQKQHLRCLHYQTESFVTKSIRRTWRMGQTDTEQGDATKCYQHGPSDGGAFPALLLLSFVPAKDVGHMFSKRTTMNAV